MLDLTESVVANNLFLQHRYLSNIDFAANNIFYLFSVFPMTLNLSITDT